MCVSIKELVTWYRLIELVVREAEETPGTFRRRGLWGAELEEVVCCGDAW